MPKTTQSQDEARAQAESEGWTHAPREGCTEMWHFRPTATGYRLRVWNTLSGTSDERDVPAHGIIAVGLVHLMVVDGAPLPGSPAAAAGVRRGDEILAVVRDGVERGVPPYSTGAVLNGATEVVVLRATDRTVPIPGGPGRQPKMKAIRFKL